MDFNEQLSLIRRNKHNAYLTHIKKKEEKRNLLRKINTLISFSLKYHHLFTNNQYVKAAVTIQKFVKKYYFQSICLNNNEIDKIPGIYRMRINITTKHFCIYSEKHIPLNKLEMHRIRFNIDNQDIISDILFRYCFDIRHLYHTRHNPLIIDRQIYYLQPEDHIRIEKLWKNINGFTRDSINYITNFEYYKSLSMDLFKDDF